MSLEECIEAAAEGRLDDLKQLRSAMETPWGNHEITEAAWDGRHIDTVKWAISEGCPYDRQTIFKEAAQGQDGHVSLLDLIHEKECPNHSSEKCFLDSEICEAAGVGGDDAVLALLWKWENESAGGCIHFDALCEGAARADNKEVLEGVVNMRCYDSIYDIFDARTCAAAAFGGALRTLKYLREIWSCEWDAETCFEAIREGHLDVLEWSVGNGCPWSLDAVDKSGQTGLEIAEARNHTHIVSFLERLSTSDAHVSPAHASAPVHGFFGRAVTP